jgi:tRNA U34 2-thiouridine synthase MnmA/TrmU
MTLLHYKELQIVKFNEKYKKEVFRLFINMYEKGFVRI